MIDISTIREWSSHGFAQLAGDLRERRASSQRTCDRLDAIALGLDGMVSESVARVRAAYRVSARNMAEEAEVISVAERVVGKLSVRMQAMKDDLAQLERSVVESGGVLQDDAIVDWGRNPFPYDIHMQRLYLAKQATGLLKQASELDSATGSVLGRLSRLELRVTSFDIDPIKKNATIVDLKKLNRAGSMTIELESVVSAEQDAIDTRIKDKAPLWNGMESETDFTACCGWLDRRRSDRVAMMDGLIGTVIVTQKVFSAMEARNVERLVG